MATAGTINEGAISVNQNDRLIVIPFTAVANTNTYATGLNGIRRVAWEPTAADDQVAVTESGGTVTFGTSGATDHAGNLLIWTADY